MDAQERAAAAHAAGGAVARVTRAVAGTHAAVTERTRAGLTPLGDLGRVPLELSALVARANYLAVEATARGAAAIAAPALAATTSPQAGPAASDRSAVPWLAALGAAFGDHLVADERVRALAVPMSLRHEGGVVDIAVQAVSGSGVPVRPTAVVFVHGLGNHESVWGRTYLELAADLGATPLTVRYTTGQAIADSGAELAGLLDELTARWPVALDRIVLVGHSMGGLVIREALTAPGPWRPRVTDVITLGTPHAGAPLERVAVRALALAGSLPTVAPLVALGDERSRGIKDLGLADVAPATPGPRWHLVAGTLGEPGAEGLARRARAGIRERLGDGLVTLDSAHGIADELVASRVVIDDAGHMALLDHPEAAEVLRATLAAG